VLNLNENYREECMNREQFQGQWNEIKGKVKEKWGKFTDDDLTQINGKREQLLGHLQKKYGYHKEKAEEELNAFEKQLSNKISNRGKEKTENVDIEEDEIFEAPRKATDTNKRKEMR